MKKCYTVFLCFISALTVTAQTRYWVGPAVGAEGVWNNVTYWSATSGGPGGASVPNGATFDVIFNQNATVRVDIAALALNSIKVTNNATAFLYTNATTDITVNSSSAGNPALDIDAGSRLHDSITAVVQFRLIMAAGSRGEIDGDLRLGSTTNGSIVLDASPLGSTVNVNGTGRIILGGSSAVTTPSQVNPTTLFFKSGSFLLVERSAGIVPLADYNVASTVRITGNTTSATSLSGSPATIGNLEYDCPGLTTNVSMNMNGSSVTGPVIKGNFRILNTNNRKLTLTSSPGPTTDPNVVTVQGNMEVSGNSVVTLGNASNRPLNFNVNGNFLQSGGTVSLQDVASTTQPTTLAIGGNLTQTGGNFTVGSAATSASAHLFIVELNGSANQNISINSTTIDNSNAQVTLRLNNPAGATLQNPLSVGKMSFVNGKLATTNVAVLTINNTSTDAHIIGGVSDNSFVNGPVKRKTAGTGTYAFPTGKGTNYRIIEVIPQAATASEFTAEYFGTNHPDPDVVLPLTGRSNAEWWNIDRLAGGANARVQLTLEGAVPNSNNSMELLVVRYNGAAWQSERGSDGTTTFGDATSGSIYTRQQTTFGAYTFGFGPFGALPIKLTAFDATKASGYNNIHWKADCTSQQAIFEIERSTDGQNFVKIESITADKLRCLQPFDYQDRNATAGINYYRIKVIDVDGGKAYYSRIAAVVNKSKGFDLVGVYPTLITSGQLKVNITSANNDKAELNITNMNGQVIKRLQASLKPGENIIYVDVAGMAAGVYHVTGINSDGQLKTLRFVKQ